MISAGAIMVIGGVAIAGFIIGVAALIVAVFK